MLAVFVLGLTTGAGFVVLILRLHEGAKPATPGPLSLVPPANTNDTPQANAVIPTVARSSGDFQPVYLDDNQLAARERAMVTPGNAVAHEQLEARRR